MVRRAGVRAVQRGGAGAEAALLLPHASLPEAPLPPAQPPLPPATRRPLPAPPRHAPRAPHVGRGLEHGALGPAGGGPAGVLRAPPPQP
eukprot:2488704-Rhodomonas_salina.2